jgi:pSer/pThr/pTyr-binding forkhead associated (FHA) protein
VFGTPVAERGPRLVLVRGHTQGGTQWRLNASQIDIGRTQGAVLFPSDTAIASTHARLVFEGTELWLVPLPTQNGVFVRVRQPVALEAGDEFVVGAQRLRLRTADEAPISGPHSDGETLAIGSPIKPTTPLVIERVCADARFNEVFHRPQRVLSIGRTQCDLNFPDDGFLSERHIQLTREGEHVLLEDLGSRNGTFVRAQTKRKLQHGDLLLLGDQVLRVELPARG